MKPMIMRLIGKMLTLWLSLMMMAVSSNAQSTLYGKVLDSESLEPLIGVVVKSSEYVSITDNKGEFRLLLPSDIPLSVSFSCVGYETNVINYTLHGDSLVSIKLHASSDMLEEVVVVANSRIGNQIGATTIPIRLLKEVPALLGEADPLKVLQSTSAVQAANEGQSNLVIRGQAPETATVLVDGISIFNSNHALGLLSTINPDAVKSINLHHSYQPACMGGKMGGVVEIHTKDGDLKQFKGNVALGMVATRANIEIPIIKGKTSLTLAGRKSLIELFLPTLTKIDEEQTNISFYDTNLKLTHHFTNRISATSSFLLSGDKIWINSAGNKSSLPKKQEWEWGTIGGSIGINYLASSKWSTQIFLSSSHFYRDEKATDKIRNDTSNTEITLRWLNNVHLSNDLTMRGGMEGIYRNVSIGNKNSSLSEGALYLDGEWSPFSKLSVQGGIRLEYPFFSILPRIAVSVAMAPSLRYELSYCLTAQRIHSLSTNNSFFQNEYWLLPSEGYVPSTSNHISTKIHYKVTPELEFSLAGFYIGSNNIVDYKEGYTKIDTYENLSRQVTIGQVYSYGVEFDTKVDWRGFKGSFSYVYSLARHHFNELNEGEWYAPYYDRPHQVNLSGSYSLGKHWRFSGSWIYTSGGMQTIALEEVPIAIKLPNIPPQWLEQVSRKNNYRLPAYHRLDLSVNYYTKNWNFAISIYNAYNRQNVYRVVLEEIDGKRVFKGMTLLPIIPSISIQYSF